jgi:hypothetical protein
MGCNVTLCLWMRGSKLFEKSQCLNFHVPAVGTLRRRDADIQRNSFLSETANLLTSTTVNTSKLCSVNLL